MKNIPEKCFESSSYLSFQFQLNARHWKGRCVMTALEKECIKFFCWIFFSATALSPSGGPKTYFRTSLEHPLIRNDAEFPKKNTMKNVFYLNYW